MLHIRPATRDDFAAIASIRNSIVPEPVSVADMIRGVEAYMAYPGALQHRLVAEAGGGVIGYGMISHCDADPAGLFNAYVAVAQSARRQGIGQQLYTAICGLAEQNGATELKVMVQGTDDASYAWALARGCRLDRQRTESVLDLKAWDGAPFADQLAKVEAQGIRLVSTTTMPAEPVLHDLYTVWQETAADIPGWEGDFGSYETWVADFTTSYRERPPVSGLALDGERLVGMSVLVLPRAEGGGAVIDMTGVLRAYRGRGIATAVKLLTIEAAVAAGVPYIRTNNDPDNPPMLAVNRKLGFAFIPGPRVMKKSLG